jgi:RNA polymerase sigma-70 factor (ECF subfamily)
MDMETANSTLDPVSGRPATLTDAEIVARVLAGEPALFEIVMRRHNQSVYRAVRAVLKHEVEVEDVMQQAYINAFTHLHQFERRARFSTWLIRIALNEAFSRRRKLRRFEDGSERGPDDAVREGRMDKVVSPGADPERQAYARELKLVLEAAVDALPDTYRSVFMLRDIEGLSTTETSEGLGVGEEAVKTRLHRARAMIRRTVTAQLGGAAKSAFEFQAPRCDRVVGYVLSVLLV